MSMKNIFAIGVGVILIVLPTSVFSDYSNFFRFLGGGLVLSGLIRVFFSRYLSEVFMSEDEISKIKTPTKSSFTKKSFPKITVSLILLIIIIAGFLFNQFQMWKLNLSNQNKQFTINISITKKNAK